MKLPIHAVVDQPSNFDERTVSHVVHFGDFAHRGGTCMVDTNVPDPNYGNENSLMGKALIGCDELKSIMTDSRCLSLIGISIELILPESERCRAKIKMQGESGNKPLVVPTYFKEKGIVFSEDSSSADIIQSSGGIPPNDKMGIFSEYDFQAEFECNTENFYEEAVTIVYFLCVLFGVDLKKNVKFAKTCEIEYPLCWLNVNKEVRQFEFYYDHGWMPGAFLQYVRVDDMLKKHPTIN